MVKIDQKLVEGHTYTWSRCPISWIKFAACWRQDSSLSAVIATLPAPCMRDGDRWICSSEKYHLRFEAITIHHTGKPVVVVQTLLSMNRENSALSLVHTKILESSICLHNSQSVCYWWKIYKNAVIRQNFQDVLWENKYCEDDILTIRFSILRIL